MHTQEFRTDLVSEHLPARLSDRRSGIEYQVAGLGIDEEVLLFDADGECGALHGNLELPGGTTLPLPTNSSGVRAD